MSHRKLRWRLGVTLTSLALVVGLGATTAPAASASSTVCNKYCDGRDAALATGNRIPVTKAAEGRTVQLHLADDDPMGWASVESAHQGDQVWLDRSWDGGSTWADGSKLGNTTTPSGYSGWRTSLFNNDDWNNLKIGYLRACYKSVSTGTNYCTGWARTTWNAGNRETQAQTALASLWHRDNGKFGGNAWWTGAVATSALIESMRQTGLHSYAYIIGETYDKNKNDYMGQFRNEFTDDSGWWALVWISAYDFTGEAKYLNTAKTISDWMDSNWDTQCGGGIYWKNGASYKASISNSLFLKVNASLHRRISGDTTYLNRANKAWNWIKSSGLIQSGDGHVLDGMSAGSCTPSNPGSTYNQGVMINALVEYWNINHNSQVIDTATLIGDQMTQRSYYTFNGILKDGCEYSSSCSGDVLSFKGPAIRGLAELNRNLSNHPYTTYITNNANSAESNAHNAAWMYGSKWDGAFDGVDVGKQSNAVELYNATHM